MPDNPSPGLVTWNGRKPKRGEFTQQPLIVTRPGWQHPLKSHRMTLQESAMWNILRSYDYGDGNIYVSDQTLAEDTGLTDRQVRNIRASLKRKGFIDWSHTGDDNRKNIYTLRAPNIKPPVNTTDKISRKKTSAISPSKSRKKTSDQLHKKKSPTKSEIRALLLVFSIQYQERTGQEYRTASTDERRARALLKTMTINEIVTHFPPFFRITDDPRISTLYTFPHFCYFLGKTNQRSNPSSEQKN